MILKSLSLKNYRRFRNLEIDFEENITAFVGKNGSGKTSIFEAIIYSLFGTSTARSSKEEIRSDYVDQKYPCEVNLIFELDSEQYHVTRKIKGKNSITDAFVFRPGREKPLAERESGVNKYITDLLGMNATTFQISVFSAQKELDKFSSLKPEERKEEIRRLLNIGVIKKAVGFLRSDIRENKTVIDTLESQKEDSKDIEELIKFIKKEATELRTYRKKIDSNYNSMKKKKKNQQNKIKELEKDYQKYINLEKGIGVCSTKLADNKSNTEEASSSIKELVEKKKQLSKLLPLKTEYQDSINKRKAFSNSKLYKELEQVEKERKKLAENIHNREKTLSASRVEISNISDKKNELESKFMPIKKIGRTSPCPTCTRPLHEHYDKLLSDFEIEKTKLDKNYTSKQLGYESERKHLTELSNKHTSQSEKIELLKDQINEKVEKLESKITKLKESNDKATSLEGEIKHLPRLKQNRQNLLKNKAIFEKELITLNDALISLGFNQQTYEEEKELMNNLSDECSEIAKDIEKIQGEINTNYEKLKAQVEKKMKQQELRKQITELESKNKQLMALEPLLLDFQSQLLARIRPILEAETGKLLHKISRGKYSDVELDEDYKIFLYDKGQKYGINRFSGGEQDLVSLCLRLAISRVIADKSGSRNINLLILDEIFGSQDDDRRQNILDAMHALSSQYRQIFLVTHISEIKDQMPIVYGVTEIDENESKIQLLS